MRDDPVGHLGRGAEHSFVHGRGIDGWTWVRDRPGIEERGYEVEAVELAREAQRVLTLERAPDMSQRHDVLPDAGGGAVVRHRKAALDVRAPACRARGRGVRGSRAVTPTHPWP